jgi:hypothetical protein
VSASTLSVPYLPACRSADSLVTFPEMKACEQTSVVTLQAKIVEPQLGRNIEPRLQLTGYNWANVQAVSYVCAHGKPLRYSCEWCRSHFKGRR